MMYVVTSQPFLHELSGSGEDVDIYQWRYSRAKVVHFEVMARASFNYLSTLQRNSNEFNWK